ncbi:MAG: pantetheine-phosphate adenylyltransferase [Elusimicrobia bacterium]|nr:pantetheine-phosphate adenylyltransferase [Elusimicrobiota bacterium]
MNKTRAVYPGSFDPITNGHIDIIKRAGFLFGNLTVAVIDNPSKKCYFSKKERMFMIRKSIGEAGIKGVTVDSFRGLLVDYLRKTGQNIVIRGLRAVSDFDYEFQMALMNRKLYGKIETVFLMTDAKFAYLSSSLVREVARLGGDVRCLVPKVVAKKIKKLK